jgi:peptidoglycan/LPS O-acetylase OafA/YrhL
MLSDSNPASFRPDIAGLRAIAVLAVIFFHFHVPGFAGGFVGVDVFFVISGYLITSIISGHFDRSNFSFAKFYRSRLLRIYPPMLILIASVLGLAYVSLDPAEYTILAKHALASIVSVANIQFYTETDYFAPARDSNWLLHLWSLSIEIQFYVVFPIILWSMRCKPKRALNIVLVALATISLGGCIVITARDASGAFYLVPTRIWEFLAGALAFRAREAIAILWRRRLALAGLALIAAPIIIYSPQTTFPGIAAVLPVLGSALILGAPSTLPILTNPVSQFLGTVSYSLYLWHWPVRVAAQHYRIEASAAHTGGLVTACLVLATLSYLTIERPISRLRHSATGFGAVAALLIGTFAVAASAAVVLTNQGFPGRAPAMIARVKNPDPLALRLHSCFLTPPEGASALRPECFDPPKPSHGLSVFLWGDSHAAHLWPGLVDAPALKSMRLLQATAGSCPPLFVPPPSPTWVAAGNTFDVKGIYLRCAEIDSKVLNEIRRRPPDVLIMSARWAYYNRFGTDVVQELRHMLDSIADLNIRTIVIGPIPEWQPTLPQILFQETSRRRGMPERMKDPSQAAGRELDLRMASMLKETPTSYLSLFDLLCDDSGCQTIVENAGTRDLVTWDYGHATKTSSDWIVDHAIAPVIGKLLPTPTSGLGSPTHALGSRQ